MNIWTLHQQSIVHAQVFSNAETARMVQMLNTQTWQGTRIYSLECAVTQSPLNYENITSTLGLIQLSHSCEHCNEFPVTIRLDKMVKIKVLPLPVSDPGHPAYFMK